VLLTFGAIKVDEAKATTVIINLAVHIVSPCGE
jgi:hypothetical protein